MQDYVEGKEAHDLAVYTVDGTGQRKLMLS